MHVTCSCGFVGSVRPIQFLDKIIGICYGCDQLYECQNTDITEREAVPMKEMPVFKSIEEAMEFAAKIPTGAKSKSPTGSSKPKRTRKSKPAEKDVSTKLEHETPSVPVYKTIHFYMRPGDSWDQLLKDGREETNYAGAGTLVFVHQHLHSAECNDSCRGMS